mmetsp:Transcript_43961/g.125334  ORF Transcript_43961/g.125334 Transcript_43961/m.125334 type:complete len:201 (-) Transcript_43961:2761-3363(-)
MGLLQLDEAPLEVLRCEACRKVSLQPQGLLPRQRGQHALGRPQVVHSEEEQAPAGAQSLTLLEGLEAPGLAGLPHEPPLLCHGCSPKLCGEHLLDLPHGGCGGHEDLHGLARDSVLHGYLHVGRKLWGLLCFLWLLRCINKPQQHVELKSIPLELLVAVEGSKRLHHGDDAGLIAIEAMPGQDDALDRQEELLPLHEELP